MSRYTIHEEWCHVSHDGPCLRADQPLLPLRETAPSADATKGHEGQHICGDCGEPWDGSFDQRRPCAICGELTMLDGTDDDKCIDCLFVEDEERATPPASEDHE